MCAHWRPNQALCFGQRCNAGSQNLKPKPQRHANVLLSKSSSPFPGAKYPNLPNKRAAFACLASRYYEIAVGFTLYDCAPHEVEYAGPPQEAAVEPALRDKAAAPPAFATAAAALAPRVGPAPELAGRPCSGGGCAKKGTLRCTRCLARWYCAKVISFFFFQGMHIFLRFVAATLLSFAHSCAGLPCVP